MKNILFIASILLSISLPAQKNFEWSKIDTVQKSRSELYAITKLFITKNFKANDENLENNNAESASFLVKGESEKKVKHLLGTYTYTYSYSVTFQVRDNYTEIKINNVKCIKASYVGADGFSGDAIKVDPYENDHPPKRDNLLTTEPPLKKLNLMMGELRTELDDIVYNYNAFVYKTLKNNNDW